MNPERTKLVATIEALLAEGWSRRAIGSKLGYTEGGITSILRSASALLHATDSGEPTPPASSGTPLYCMQQILTPRQQQMAALLARGLKPRQIADRLGVRIQCVHAHLANVRKRLEEKP